jgi:hypothetical protein
LERSRIRDEIPKETPALIVKVVHAGAHDVIDERQCEDEAGVDSLSGHGE